MVSLETCFRFIRMDCADVDDALTTVTGQWIKGGRSAKERLILQKSVSMATPWKSMCSVTT